MNTRGKPAQPEHPRTIRPLFRPEVFAAGAASEEGEILLITPLSSRWLTLVAMCICAVMLLFLVVGRYAQRVTLHGLLVSESEPMQVRTPYAGVVLSRRVARGQTIRHGDVLYVVSIPRTEENPLAIHTHGDRQESLQQPQRKTDARHDQQFTITAPLDGIVSGSLQETGQKVDAGLVLLSIVPTTPRLQARFYAPGSVLDFIKVGQWLQLRYPASPSQAFGPQAGNVLSISHGPVSVQDLPRSMSTPGHEPLYRIDVALPEQSHGVHGHAPLLAPGMALQSEVSLQQRRLIEWIFDPIRRF